MKREGCYNLQFLSSTKCMLLRFMRSFYLGIYLHRYLLFTYVQGLSHLQTVLFCCSRLFTLFMQILSILKQKRNVRFSWYCIFRSNLEVATKIKPKCQSNVRHTKNGNYLILSSDLEGLLNLMCTQLFPLS